MRRQTGPTLFNSPSERASRRRAIAQQLQSLGLIQDGTLFEAYVRANGLDSRIEAGTFTLNTAMTPVQIAAILQHAKAASITVTIPEGWRLEQVASYLSAAGVLDGAAYRRLAASGELSAPGSGTYAFLGSRPAGASLEGYLFPDTYELPAEGATASDLIGRQLDDFAAQVVPLYRQARADGSTTLSMYEALTLASIVEREAVVADERPVIAGVYLNRLVRGINLEADPTVQYALGYQASSRQWWKTPVFLGEVQAGAQPLQHLPSCWLATRPDRESWFSKHQRCALSRQARLLVFRGSARRQRPPCLCRDLRRTPKECGALYERLIGQPVTRDAHGWEPVVTGQVTR